MTDMQEFFRQAHLDLQKESGPVCNSQPARAMKGASKRKNPYFPFSQGQSASLSTPVRSQSAEDVSYSGEDQPILNKLIRESQNKDASLFHQRQRSYDVASGTRRMQNWSLDSSTTFGSMDSSLHCRQSSISSLDDERLGPLPQGWTRGCTPDGQIYFINERQRTTTWVDPRTKRAVPGTQARSHNDQMLIQKHVMETYPVPLPPGWEVEFSDANLPYFVDHNTRKTTWTDPRTVGEHAHQTKSVMHNLLSGQQELQRLVTKAQQTEMARLMQQQSSTTPTPHSIMEPSPPTPSPGRVYEPSPNHLNLPNSPFHPRSQSLSEPKQPSPLAQQHQRRASLSHIVLPSNSSSGTILRQDGHAESQPLDSPPALFLAKQHHPHQQQQHDITSQVHHHQPQMYGDHQQHQVVNGIILPQQNEPVVRDDGLQTPTPLNDISMQDFGIVDDTLNDLFGDLLDKQKTGPDSSYQSLDAANNDMLFSTPELDELASGEDWLGSGSFQMEQDDITMV